MNLSKMLNEILNFLWKVATILFVNQNISLVLLTLKIEKNNFY